MTKPKPATIKNNIIWGLVLVLGLAAASAAGAQTNNVPAVGTKMTDCIPQPEVLIVCKTWDSNFGGSVEVMPAGGKIRNVFLLPGQNEVVDTGGYPGHLTKLTEISPGLVASMALKLDVATGKITPVAFINGSPLEVSNKVSYAVMYRNQVVNGKDGRDGKDGKDGKDGRDGAPGRDGRDGKDGTGLVIKPLPYAVPYDLYGVVRQFFGLNPVTVQVDVPNSNLKDEIWYNPQTRTGYYIDNQNPFANGGPRVASWVTGPPTGWKQALQVAHDGGNKITIRLNDPTADYFCLLTFDKSKATWLYLPSNGRTPGVNIPLSDVDIVYVQQ